MRRSSRYTVRSPLSRQALVVGAVALLAAGVLTACGGSGGSGGKTTLVVASFGGDLDQGLAKAALPFEKKYNATVKFVPGTSVENVAKALASEPHPTTDVVFGNDSSIYNGSTKGAWAKLDTSVVTNLGNIIPIAKPTTGDSVGIGLNIGGIFYAPKVYTKHGWDPPTSYADVFKYLSDKDYCGKIGMEDPSVTLPLEEAYAAGKKNVLAGIKYLSGLKKCIPVLEQNTSKFEANMQAGQYVVGFYNGLHTIPLIQKGADLKFVVPREGGTTSQTAVAVVKHAPHSTLAQQFVNSLLTKGAQDIIVNQLAFGPVYKGYKVDPKLKAEGVPDAADLPKLLKLPLAEFAAHQESWTNTFRQAFS